MKRNLVCMVVVLGLALCTGCKTAQRGALGSMNGHFQQMHFQSCLDDINRARSYGELTPIQRAETLLIEALCFEELGRPMAAEANYVKLVKEFPGTSFATRAQQRLLRQEPDQREHLVLSFGDEQWSLLGKQMMANVWIRTFRSMANRHETIVTTSAFVGPQISLGALVERSKAEMALHFPDTKWELVSSDAEEAILLYQTSAHTEAGVARMVRTEGYYHMVAFSLKSSTLPPEKREKWIKLLRQAKIQPQPAKKPIPGRADSVA